MRFFIAENYLWSFLHLFTILVSVVLVQGCIVLPIPTGEDKVLAGRAFGGDELSFIQPGITTRHEVTERLGEPTLIWEEERIFAYNWQTKWGVLLWAIGGAPGATGGAQDIVNKYALLIRFDPNGRVERFEATERSRSDSYGEHLEKWLRKVDGARGVESPQPATGATDG